MEKLENKSSVAIIGAGWVGKAYASMFPGCVIYDEPQVKKYYTEEKTKWNKELESMPEEDRKGLKPRKVSADDEIKEGRRYVNECEMAIVCVPTNPTKSGELDMSIVEEVVGWIETPLILIKSALQPGTVDRLVKKTGKKIAVSVEFIGEGQYFIPPWKYPDPKYPDTHNMIIVGGELDTATKCAEILWSKMSPDVKIHLVTALEAEITKLVENSYGALKVTWINTLYNLATKADTNFIRIHQAWTSDGRVDSMHQRTTSKSRGWKSKCWSKDIPALATFAHKTGAKDMAKLLDTIMELNEEHLSQNEKPTPK